MPTFEYSCDKCEILFEELLLKSSEIQEYRDWHPCPQCGGRADREKVSLTNFNFKAPGGPTQGSGVHGQSGIHDLDYPNLDKAVGRSSAVRWNRFNKIKKERDKIRKETGTNALAVGPDGKVKPLSSEVAKKREKVLSDFSKAKKGL